MPKSLNILVSILCLVVAQRPVLANVIGVDVQTFNPTTSGLDFVTVQSSETLEPGFVNFGFYLNHATNTLPFFPATSGTVTRDDFQDASSAMDLNFGLGLTKNWEIGFSFPILLNRTVKNVDDLDFISEGATEIRFSTKYRIAGGSAGGIAMVGSVNFNQIENNPFAGTESGPTGNFELVGDTTLGRAALGLNIGYRLRDEGEPIPGITLQPMTDQFLVSGAVSYLFTSLDTKLIFEVFSGYPTKRVEGFNRRDLSSLEALLGLKYDVSDRFAIHAGIGRELQKDIIAPDFRAYIGFNWSLGPLCQCDHEVDILEVPVEVKVEVEKVKYVDRAPEVVERIVLPGFFFKTGTAQFQSNSDYQLRSMVANIRSLDEINRIVVEGHTDSLGESEVNEELSLYRAQTIRKYLLEHIESLKPSQVEAIGYGESKPIADNAAYQGRSKNRRVELKIYRRSAKVESEL